jgi:hypothetical protein
MQTALLAACCNQTSVRCTENVMPCARLLLVAQLTYSLPDMIQHSRHDQKHLHYVLRTVLLLCRHLTYSLPVMIHHSPWLYSGYIDLRPVSALTA